MSRNRNGAACTQCRRREPPPKRRTVSAATASRHESGNPGIELPATLLPVAGLLRGDELQAVQELRALVAVHPRHDESQRKAVLRRQRLLVHPVGDQGIGQRRLTEGETVGVEAIEGMEGDERGVGLRVNQVENSLQTNALPANILDTPALDAVKVADLPNTWQREQFVISQ